MKTLKIIAILYMFSITFLGASDALLKNKEGESNIIDIGYKYPKTNYNPTIPKELVSSDPLEEFVDNLLDQRGRVLSEKYDCEIDYLGRENCPIQSNVCEGEGQFDRGVSNKIDRTVYKLKEQKTVPREESLNPNQIAGDYKLAPNYGNVDGSRFNILYSHSAKGGKLPSAQTLYNEGYQKDGKFAMRIFNYGSGWGGIGIIPSPDRITTIVNSGSTVGTPASWQIKSGNGNYAVAVAEWDSIPSSLSYRCDDYCLIGKPDDNSFGFSTYTCPSDYLDADGIISESGQCKKEYSYYEYSCKTDKNLYDLPWIGPIIDAGGDCEAVCGDYGCSCNSATPPLDNCTRDTYICPTDSDQLCNITTEEGDSLDQVVGNYIYQNGTVNTYSKEIIIPKTCANYETWDKATDKCVSELVLECKAEGSFYDENLKKCVQYIEKTDENPSCESGGYYDSSLGSCVSTPICDNGVFDIHEKRCVIPVTCLDGFSYSSESENCERPLETKIMKCPQSSDIYEEGNPDVCKTSPVIATAKYDGESLGYWWHCDSCYGSDSIKNAFLEGIAGAGGTSVTKIRSSTDVDEKYFRRTYEITTNATSPYFIQFNSSDGGIVINPGDVIHWSSRKFLNTTTGKSISAGGKPYLYIHSSIECSSWRTEPGTKDYPAHQVCNDPINQYAYCPDGFELTTDPSGGQLCYVPPTCQTGYTMSSNGLYCSINATCEAGYTADYDNNICIKDRDDGSEINLERATYELEAKCPYGELSTESGNCAIIPTCETGSIFNSSAGKCLYEGNFSPIFCEPNYTFVTSLDPFLRENVSGSELASAQDLDSVFSCVISDNPYCENGTYNSSLDACSEAPICDTGVFDLSLKSCVIGVQCSDGFSYNSTTKTCEKEAEIKGLECPSGTYDGAQYLLSEQKCIYSETQTFKSLGGTPSYYGWGSNILTSYAIATPGINTVNNYSMKFYAPSSATYKIQFMVDNDGTMYIDGSYIGRSAFGTGTQTITKSKYFSKGEHTITMTGTNWHGPGGLAAAISLNNLVIWNTRDGQEYQSCPSGTTMEGGICTYITACEAGYTLNASDATCYKNPTDGSSLLMGSDVYQKPSFCSVGEVNNNLGICSIVPTCEVGSEWNAEEGRCLSEYVPNCAGENGVCLGEKELTCTEGYTYNETTKSCEAEGFCEYGTKASAEGCVKSYSYSEYSCPDDTEGPLISSGGDCLGSCGPYGCSCNSTVAPANNCKKPAVVEEGAIVVTSKRPLLDHVVSGDFNTSEFETYKGFSCGSNCDFGIKKITGKDNEICFESGNGRNSCILVSDCGFSGTITNPNLSSGLIKELNLTTPYNLELGAENPYPEIQTSGFECPGGLIYNDVKKICDSPTQNFYNWSIEQNGGNGNWSVKESGSYVHQSVNSSKPTFFLSNALYPNSSIFEGKIKVDPNSDDDYIGLVFDYKDSNNYRLVRWAYKGRTHNDEILIYGKVVNGSLTIIKQNDSKGWVHDKWYTIKTIFNPDMTQVYIDNELLIDYNSQEDNDIDSESLGNMGFYNYSQGVVNYKDFYIKSKVMCDSEYEWKEETRSCVKEVNEIPVLPSISSTCRMNGHVGWSGRSEGIISVISDPEDSKRILFWDSYLDKDIGFLEFPSEVETNDRAEGFITEEEFPYEMSERNFTAIDKIGNNTFFIADIDMSTCSQISEEKGLTISESFPSEYLNDLRNLSGNRYLKTEVNPTCLSGFYDENFQECIEFKQFDTSLSNDNPDFIWDPDGADEIQSAVPFFASSSGYYTITLETKGSLDFSVDGILRVMLRKNGTAEKTISVYMSAGTHSFSVAASKDGIDSYGGGTFFTGEQGFSIKVSSPSFNTVFSSGHWVFGGISSNCEEENMIELNGVCLSKGVKHCPYIGSKLNEETGRCDISPKCILSGTVDYSFDIEYAIKSETKIDTVKSYKCSPLTCEDHSCQTADCPIAEEGGEPYLGTLLAPGEYVEEEECTDQSCDANLPYYAYCAKENGCDTARNSLVFETEDGQCKSLYCEEGTVMNLETQQCESLDCPEGSTENSAGRCVRD